VIVEAGGCKLRQAGLGEFHAIELQERRRDGMEAKGTAFLQHDAGKLAPHLDDEGFGHGLDHGLNLLFEV
jgi:hypothetical protein